MPRLRLASGADIAAALESPDRSLRLCVLEAVARDPARASGYDFGRGRDLVDVLEARWEKAADPLEENAVLATVGCCEGPRAESFFARVMRESDEDSTLVQAAGRLARLPPQRLRALGLADLLWAHGHATRGRLVATLLARDPDLSGADAVRTSLLADVEVPQACWSEATAAAWIQELRGSRADVAMRRLDEQGSEPVAAMVSETPATSLPATTCAWLVQRASVTRCENHEPWIAAALDDPREAVARAALAVVVTLVDLAPVASRVQALRRHPDAGMRLLAARIPLPVDETLLDREKDPQVRAALVSHDTSLARLAAHLEDEAWQVRAAAADALASCGDAGLHVARALLSDPREAVRVSAARIVCHLEGLDGLEEAISQETSAGTKKPGASNTSRNCGPWAR